MPPPCARDVGQSTSGTSREAPPSSTTQQNQKQRGGQERWAGGGECDRCLAVPTPRRGSSPHSAFPISHFPFPIPPDIPTCPLASSVARPGTSSSRPPTKQSLETAHLELPILRLPPKPSSSCYLPPPPPSPTLPFTTTRPSRHPDGTRPSLFFGIAFFLD